MGDWPDELTSSELLACALGEHPAFRSGADLDRIDPDRPLRDRPTRRSSGCPISRDCSGRRFA